MSESKLPTAVVDTNLFVSGLILKRGHPYELLEGWRRRRFLLITSSALTNEIAEVLSRPRIRQRYQIGDEDLLSLAGDARLGQLRIISARGFLASLGLPV